MTHEFTRDLVSEAIRLDDEVRRDYAQWEMRQRSAPPVVHKVKEDALVQPQQPTTAPSDVATRKFVMRATQALAEITGEATGRLEKRIVAVESENKKLREELDQAVSELTLLRAVTRGDVAQIGKRHVA